MTDHREQAIRDVAAALGRSPGRLSYAVKNGGLGVKAKELAYAVDTTEKLLAAEARVLELEAERAEQLSILTSVGPITCRNGKQHEHYDGCVYCRIEELEAFLEKVISVNAASTEPDVGELSYALGGIAYEAMKLQPKGE